MPALRAAVGRGGHSSGRFPHVSFGTKEPLCAQQQRGHSQRHSVPTCLPITPTRRGWRVGVGNGEGFCQVSGSSQESGIKTHHQRNPDKKSIILLPGVVFQGGPRLGQGQALSRFCSVGFPGAFGGPNGVGVSGIHPSKAGAQEQQPLCPPPHCTFVLFTYSPP